MASHLLQRGLIQADHVRCKMLRLVGKQPPLEPLLKNLRKLKKQDYLSGFFNFCNVHGAEKAEWS